MNKIKKILLIILVVLFCSTPIIVGCNFSFSSSNKLKSPYVSLSESSKCLTWDSVENAENYDIYCNEVKVDTIENSNNTTTIYDLTAILDESGEYKFFVVATTSSIYIANSEKSNIVTFNYIKKENITPTTPEGNIDNEQKISFTVSDKGVLSYLPLENIDVQEYYIYLYSNSSGLNSYVANTNTVNLIENSYLTIDEIYAIRMGYKNDNNTYISSDIVYYNPDDYGVYTDDIYLFDGLINDYYIETLQEAQNLVYYTFVNRITEFNIKLSSEFKEFVSDSFNGTYINQKMDNLISYCFEQFYETMAYQSANSNGGFVSNLGNSTEFKVKVSYGGVTECDTTVRPSSYYQQAISTPYYDTVDYIMLEEQYGNDYDNFVSDQQFLYTEVSTSEQLYWAIENKVTPIITNVESRAYKIYNEAKDVLRSIISESMTDYEKALSIFDWICINTSYDYTSYTVANGYTSTVANYPTTLPCFYLEGVFMTGYSVCDGFSKAYSLMCNMLGIDCIRIVGDAQVGSSTGGHAWNKVLIDINPEDDIPAQYYLVDITWTEIVSEDESLSHTYFGLSDEDVKETHFEYAGRKNKYSKYKANDNLRYYEYQTFEYNGTEHDLVISNTQELIDMFDYFLLSNRDTIEIIIDYDYMVSEYEKVNGEGSYRSETGVEKTYYDSNPELVASEYNKATDTMTYYNYTPVYTLFGVNYEIEEIVMNNYMLRTTFQTNVMKTSKFQEQYLFLVDENQTRIYSDNDKSGILYIMTQNLLIDAEGEVEHLIEYFDQKNIYGSYTLYVSNSMLNTSDGSTWVQKVQNLFAEQIELSNLNVEFEFVSANEEISDGDRACVFTFTTSAKV